MSFAASLPFAAATARRWVIRPRRLGGADPCFLPLAGEVGPDGRLALLAPLPPPEANLPRESRL